MINCLTHQLMTPKWHAFLRTTQKKKKKSLFCSKKNVKMPAIFCSALPTNSKVGLQGHSKTILSSLPWISPFCRSEVAAASVVHFIQSKLALFDTLDFLLNILLNWIQSISTFWINFWIEFCPKKRYKWISFRIEFC